MTQDIKEKIEGEMTKTIVWIIFLGGWLWSFSNTINRAITVYEQREKANTMVELSKIAQDKPGSYYLNSFNGMIIER